MIAVRQVHRSVLCALAVLVLLTPGAAPSAPTLPPGFSLQRLTSILTSPTAMAVAPDGRVFVCEQAGTLRVIKNDTLLAQPFLTVTVSSLGERGLLGIAFDPNFLSNQYLYVYYTATSPAIHNRVSRFTASGDTALPGSEVVLLDLDDLSSATNHNGGAIHFGPDARLYIGTGDNANGTNSQTLTNLLGKMLRINSDGSLPLDNPFDSVATGKNQAIWALGLRNPFTFDFQNGSGRMLINDVGENTWEEIDDGIIGSNYGWPATEGFTSNPAYRGPLYEYGHSATDSSGCAITGGAFYNPASLQFPPSYVGDYFYMDYCEGWIRLFHPADSTTGAFATGFSFAVDLHVSNDGSLYVLSRNSGGPTGSVDRIQYTTSLAPSITQQPADVIVTVNQPASFTVAASGPLPISYAWQRNGSPIAGATNPTYTLAAPQLSDSGARFSCVVSNAYGSATSNSALLRVTPSLPPTATILQPIAGTLYSGGDTIIFSGSATDPQDGTLPASAFTWRVDFQHDTHSHPFLPTTSGITGGSFGIPTSGETSDTVWYRIYLFVTASSGLSDTVIRDILPRTSTDTLTSIPPGLQINLDGIPRTAPFVFTGVVGILRGLDAPSPQTQGAQSYKFLSWSDGGAESHQISTPLTNTKFTASFLADPAVPVPDTPLDGAINEPLSLTILWGSSAGVTAYTLAVSTDSAFATVLVNDPTIVDTFRIVTGLTGGTRYYWRVRATNAGGASAWSPVRSFSTAANPVPAISSISPPARAVGLPSFVLTVDGSNFLAASTIRVNGSNRTTTFVNSTRLTAAIPASDIAALGTDTITVFNPSPGGGISNALLLAVRPVVVSVKAFLEGPYANGAMSTALRASNAIPASQPYAAPPWSYAGAEHSSSIPAVIVDWVLLELRSGTTGSAKAGMRAAFLRSDGTVVDTDGSAPVQFPGIVSGNYYIVVRHRNHLAAMTATAAFLDDTSRTYDFTTSASASFGAGVKGIAGGKFGLLAGDYSADGFIDVADFAGPDNDRFKGGYRQADLNLDGIVDAGDFVYPDNNRFKGSSVPK